MATTRKLDEKTAEELVRAKHPTAFVDDDGDWVYIRTTTNRPCRECGGIGYNTVTDFTKGSLGSGGTSCLAWKSAAQTLGIIRS